MEALVLYSPDYLNRLMKTLSDRDTTSERFEEFFHDAEPNTLLYGIGEDEIMRLLTIIILRAGDVEKYAIKIKVKMLKKNWRFQYVIGELSRECQVPETVVEMVMIMLMELQMNDRRDLFEYTDQLMDLEKFDWRAIQEFFLYGKNKKNWTRLAILMSCFAGEKIREYGNMENWIMSYQRRGSPETEKRLYKEFLKNLSYPLVHLMIAFNDVTA